MERSEGFFWIDLPNPSPAGTRLATALADRLDAVMTGPFRVHAVDGWVGLYVGAEFDSGTGVAPVLDREVDPGAAPGAKGAFAWLVASVAWNVLSSVQDGIANATKEPWPKLPQGGMAMPGSRTDGTRVYMWYGPDDKREAGAVLTFPPIDVDALGRSE